MTTLDQTLQSMVQQGVISRQQAQLKAANKDSIA
jgi:Tfp pilus assembly pilus retraction ATPase PilT